MPPTSPTSHARPFSKPATLEWKASTILVGIAVVVPFVLHQIPAASAVPWGARFLAMFIAPFLGVLLFRLHVALIPALIAPALNYVLFGRPIASLVGLLTVELVVFAIAAFILIRASRRFWLAGPAAYLAAKAVSGSLIGWFGAFQAFAPAGAFVMGSIGAAIPGLIVLTALHVLLVRGEGSGEG